jgi:sulfoxide reductase heme-binding subunit YedZ
MKLNQKTKTLALKIIIHLAALLPIINLYANALADQLGADPVKAVIHYTGIGAFNLLLITLCISPLAKLLKQSFLMNMRRLLGLYAFTYAVLHLMSFIAFDLQFDFSLFVSEIIKRPYITIGMLAFILLSLLAITSITILKRKMGKNWQKLHNVNYLIILLVAIHFYWSVKSEISEPLFYFMMSVALLFLRRQKIKRWLINKK